MKSAPCRWTLLLVAGTIVACTDSATPLAPPSTPSASSAWDAGADGEAGPITVMSRNMYIGADVDLVIRALMSPNPADDFPALMQAIAVLQRTDFPARANALADEIAHARPHVVGLQEVEDVSIDLRALGVPVQIEQHFLPMLTDALAARGLHYVVAARVTNTVDAPFPGLTVVDDEALLVDADRVAAVSNVVERAFAANIGPVAPGIVLRRGWVRVDAVIEGTPITVASTHLEPFAPAGLRALQAQELVASVAGAPRVILLGDFNDVPGSPMHAVTTGAGFVDSWAASNAGDPGFTCCHLADLSNATPTLSQRIDYVFARGMGDPFKGKVTLVGERPKDRVAGPAYPIWPSDHAGVVAKFHPIAIVQ